MIVDTYHLNSTTADESNEYNKSSIDKAGWAKEKGVPAGRAGSDEDMAQAALMLAVNQYAYGQVGFPMSSSAVVDDELILLLVTFRLSPLREDTCLNILELFYTTAPLWALEMKMRISQNILALLYSSTHACIIACFSTTSPFSCNCTIPCARPTSPYLNVEPHGLSSSQSPDHTDTATLGSSEHAFSFSPDHEDRMNKTTVLPTYYRKQNKKTIQSPNNIPRVPRLRRQ